MHYEIKIKLVLNGWVVTQLSRRPDKIDEVDTIFLKNEGDKLEEFVGRLIGTREMPKKQSA